MTPVVLVLLAAGWMDDVLLLVLESVMLGDVSWECGEGNGGKERWEIGLTSGGLEGKRGVMWLGGWELRWWGLGNAFLFWQMVGEPQKFRGVEEGCNECENWLT
jgi:hypothetical protein